MWTRQIKRTNKSAVLCHQGPVGLHMAESVVTENDVEINKEVTGSAETDKQ